MSSEEAKAKYGDEWTDFGCPYRNRMLRFDIGTQAWTLLKSTSDLHPKALCFAAEMNYDNGQTQLLIGRGYGFTPESKSGAEALKEANAPAWGIEAFTQWDENCFVNSQAPVAWQNIYEVSIADERGICSARDDLVGKSWAWKFFDVPGEFRPTVQAHISACSPTLHLVLDLTYEDFLKPPCDVVRPNDESTLIGIRVKLHGLQGRKDLNGQVGRCGCWLENKERYQIFLPSYSGGPVSISVKASNLRVAKPLDLNAGRELENQQENLSFGLYFKRKGWEGRRSNTSHGYLLWASICEGTSNFTNDCYGRYCL